MASAQPIIIAHRGASGELPENTFPAYALAVEQRADMIETRGQGVRIRRGQGDAVDTLGHLVFDLGYLGRDVRFLRWC